MSLKFKNFIRTKFLFLILITFIPLIFGLIIYMTNEKDAYAAVNLSPDNHEIISLGKSVYSQNCASFHGIKLEGQKNWMSRLPD